MDIYQLMAFISFVVLIYELGYKRGKDDHDTEKNRPSRKD